MELDLNFSKPNKLHNKGDTNKRINKISLHFALHITE